MRLIDADKLKKAIKKSAITLPKYGSAIFLNNINDLIDNAPTVKTYCYFCGQTEHGQIKETTFDDYLKEQLKDPEFRKEYEKLCDEEKEEGGKE